MQEEAGHSRWVDGRFSKHGDLPARLILGAARHVDVCICCQNIQSLYRDLNWVQSYIQRFSTIPCFSRLHPWNLLLPWEQWAEHTFQAGVGASHLWVNWWSCPLNELLQHPRTGGFCTRGKGTDPMLGCEHYGVNKADLGRGWVWEPKRAGISLWFSGILAGRHQAVIYLWPISSSHTGRGTSDHTAKD